MKKIKLGVSECLLGEKVRFDGGHKRDRFVVETLAPYCEFVPICPEVAIGMGIPRQPVHLIGTKSAPRLVNVKDESIDWTDKMQRYNQQITKTFGELAGYILKSKSPTCGMERVRIYHKDKQSEKTGVGLFAASLMQAWPNLPVEEEGRLNDPILRENFIERLFAQQRWLELQAERVTMAKLVRFHQIHKLSLLAHNTQGYQRLGNIIANPDKNSPQQVASQYIEQFSQVMKMRANHKKNTNVLMHILGYFKKSLDSASKAEILELIEQYRLGFVPLIVPLTLLKHFLRLYPNEYLSTQTYLHPHPSELMLRNHI